MLVFVTGLPGRFSEWCGAVVARLAEQALGPTERLYADTLEQLAHGVMRSGSARTIVTSHQPGGALRRALIDAGHNFIVAIDDPLTALAELALGRGIAPAAATRAVASSCGALIGVRDAPGALVLRRDRNSPGPATVAAIARHLNLAVDLVAMAELAADETPPTDPAAWWGGLPVGEQAMIAGALDPYIARGQTTSLVWTGNLFFLGDRPNEPLTSPVDITGRARRLIDGPNILLPPGAWRASLSAQFSRGAAEHEFLVETSAEQPIASGTLRPQREGSAELNLDFSIDDASEQPIAIRVSSVRAAFDGAIADLRVTLAPAENALQIVVDVKR